MIIVSIDCGIKNLAYIVAEISTPITKRNNITDFLELNKIKILSASNKNISCRGAIIRIYKNLVNELESINTEIPNDATILIERQIPINAKIYSIFSSIITYFLSKKKEIVIIHPNKKNSLVQSLIDRDGKKRIKFISAYKYNKACSVDFVKTLNLIQIENFPKKDDISDCITQMFAYLLKN